MLWGRLNGQNIVKSSSVVATFQRLALSLAKLFTMLHTEKKVSVKDNNVFLIKLNELFANSIVTLSTLTLNIMVYNSGSLLSSFGWPPGFSHLSKNQNFRQKFHKNYKKSSLSATKASTNKKCVNFYRSEINKISI